MAGCENSTNNYFTGKTAVVTGSSSGIGLACIKALLEHGIKNIVMSSEFDIQDVKNELKNLQETFDTSRILYIKCDVSKNEDMKNLLKSTIENFGRLDIFVNNAGVFDEENLNKTIDVNLKGSIMGTEFALNYMSKEKGGQGGTIVNVISTCGLHPMASAPIYTATKYALIGYTQSMSLPFHFDKSGVRMMALCPGLTDTGLIQEGKKAVQTNPTPLMLEWFNKISKQPSQSPTYPATCLINMLTKGHNGSMWVSQNEEIFEVKCPEFKTFERKYL